MEKARIAAAVAAAVALVACDITQEHIDEASERLAEATVAQGSPPTAAQITAAVPLRTEHLAGSSWRLIDMGNWPDAAAVVTLGSNGRIVWHVGPAYFHDITHWRVSGSMFEFVGRVPSAAVRVDANTVCIGSHNQAENPDPCVMVFQRVTP